MGWKSVSNAWYATFSATTPVRVSVKKNLSVSSTRTVTYESNTPYTFISGRTYQYITNLWGFLNSTTPDSASFSIITPGWSEFLDYNKNTGATSGILPSGWTNSNYYFYATSPEDVTTKEIIQYDANSRFGTSSMPYTEGIVNFKFSELDFLIQGFSFYKWPEFPYSPYDANDPNNFLYPINSLGWTYDPDYGTSELFHWYDHSTVGYYPVGGDRTNKRTDIGYRQNNYIAKFVPYINFNLKFNYQNEGDFPLEIWLTNSLPSKNPGSFSMPGNAQLLATIGDFNYGTYSSNQYSIPVEFYSLPGLKYILFKGPFVGTQSSPTYSNIFLSNIKVEGGYNSANNKIFSTDSISNKIIPTGLTGATFSISVGAGNTINATNSLTISQVNSKIGNGVFKSGIWENGVWNNGLRYDDSVIEFYEVSQFFNYNFNKKWRFQIKGTPEAVSNFEVGDKVSIGNIVAIDINENRKILRSYYTIFGILNDSIILEVDNEFPLRRIEKDSENHRIYVTKNIWLNGAFLNGYFKGIWNYGLFKGYPLITEMTDSHWIDGKFDGGHFKSSIYQVPKFVETIFYREKINGKLGLTFSDKHGLAVNDIIKIDKDDKSVNPQYDGETTIVRVVNDYHVVTNLTWGRDVPSEGGTVSVTLSKGLVQRMVFKDNNVSSITSNQSLESTSVFQFDSWMDVNYDNETAVNIGKPTRLFNELSQKDYSENNLYGYPTYDILESVSTFRDSFSNTTRNYNLGSKFKIFNDYIGESGNFENKFGPTGFGESSFINYGWTFSRYSPGSLSFSRTESDGTEDIGGKELQVDAYGRGGTLDFYLTNNESILGRTNQEVEKNRYTFVEFDLVYYNSSLFLETSIPSISAQTKSGLFPKYSSKGLYFLPTIHFNNINTITRNIYYGGGVGTASTVIPATYLPIVSNIIHATTPKKRKTEYFFNKKSLSMHFLGTGVYNSPGFARYILDNLHFYEVDMIPFFKYFQESNINKGVQIPYRGLAPKIDYNDESFSFIDNISFGQDSILISSSDEILSGIGTGINAEPPINTIFNPPRRETSITDIGNILSGE